MQGSPTSLAHRSLAIAQVDAVVASGGNVRRACLDAGVKFVSYYRWKAAATQAASGLIQPKVEKKRGRKPLFELTELETKRLRFWRLVKGSIPLAMEAAIAESTTGDESPYFTALRECQRDGKEGGAKLDAAKATALRTYWQAFVQARRPVAWPMSIQRACRVSEDEEAAFRGPRALSSRAGTERRGAFIIDEDGKRLPWFAGAIWCSDDMSINEAFKFHDAAAERELVGRQALFTSDAFSLSFLGCTHIGRDRDSYRAEDIADHFAALVDEHGLPLIWRIEKGRWKNNFIHGAPIPDEFDDEGEPKRFGGLDALVHLAVKFNSRGKEIEGCFNLLQDMLAHGGDGRALSIGRERGEFEKATRLMTRVDRDPEALAKFWSIEQSAEHVAQVMRLFNSRPKQRQTFGNQTFAPSELWARHVKRPCPSNERWRFLPIKTDATIRKGIIEVKVKHYPVSFRFRVHGGSRISGAHFVDGHEVMVAFHPGQAWDGCVIFNRDTSARNRDGWGWLERIGVADHMADVPQEDLRAAGGYSPGQSRAAAQVRKEYRGIITGTDLAGPRRSHAQDSFGNALAAASTGSAAAPAPRRSTIDTAEPVRTRGRDAHEGRMTPRHVLTTAADDFDEADELAALSAR